MDFYLILNSFVFKFLLFISHIKIGGGRFYDPRCKQSFRFDHLRKEASDYQSIDVDTNAEPWRSILDVETLAYTANHYRHGVFNYNIFTFIFLIQFTIIFHYIYVYHLKNRFALCLVNHKAM